MARSQLWMILLFLSCIERAYSRCPPITDLPPNAEGILYEPPDRFDPLYIPTRQQLRQGFEEGFFATIVCQENYEVIPAHPRKCLGDAWSNIITLVCPQRGRGECNLQTIDPICQPLRCYHPAPCDYGTITPSQQAYDAGDIITYDCERGLSAFPSNERSCLSSGEWSGPDPKCVTPDEFIRLSNKQCPILEAPLFGFIVGPEGLQGIDDVTEFECFPTLTLLGSHRRKCLNDTLEWSGEQPTCVAGLEIDIPIGENLTDYERLIPDTKNCRYFYHYSLEGDLFHKICPSNLFFHPIIKWCDYQEASGCIQEAPAP
ncbi:unnamed protein product [Owenia fusiformis]|uniref:Uncharacterized protein n=1 Tax=Owenia fusiformis TaxID=6347 RepID=A0A8S4PTW5_OWEFU|nr:unnamed protein product [Owenia fusiformis]